MAKQSNPYDFSSFFASFDPTKFIQELSSGFGNYKVPGVDLDSLLASQRKNLEALTKANQQALEGTQAIAERQREILQQAIEEASSIIKELSTFADPQELAQKQTAVMQKAFEKAFETMRELAEMTSKTNQQAIDTLNARFRESLAELRAAADTGK